MLIIKIKIKSDKIILGKEKGKKENRIRNEEKISDVKEDIGSVEKKLTPLHIDLCKKFRHLQEHLTSQYC